jgi:gamma-glutamyltranspeptidase/glutathione hydrolase
MNMHGVAIGRGAVVSLSPLASEVGIHILKKGGNAVDAAVATSLTMAVVEPGWMGLGGGGFGLVHMNDGSMEIVDHREVAPNGINPSDYDVEENKSTGYSSIGVPGFVAGLLYLHEKYGLLSLKDVFHYPIKYASEGIAVSPLWEFAMKYIPRSLEKIRRNKYSSDVFLRNNEAYKTGELLIQKDLANTLKYILEEGVDTFYRGHVADQIIKDMEENGGTISSADLNLYRVKIREPLVYEVGGYTIVTMPPPGSGALLVEGLKILNELSLDRGNIELLLLRTLQLLMYERDLYIHDPDFIKDTDPSKFLSDKHIEEAKNIITDESQPIGKCCGREDRGTAHISVVDQEGNMVSLTETLECFMGSGVAIKDTGLLMNDELHDFDYNPKSSNYIQPGKRPRSSMSPTIVFKDGKPMLVIGASGGTRIVSALLQVLLYRLFLDMDLVSAMFKPRLHYFNNKIYVEGFNLKHIPRDTVVEDVSRRGILNPYFGKYSIYMGAVEAIEFLDNGLVLGVSDPRKQFGVSTLE